MKTVCGAVCWARACCVHPKPTLPGCFLPIIVFTPHLYAAGGKTAWWPGSCHFPAVTLDQLVNPLLCCLQH